MAVALSAGLPAAAAAQQEPSAGQLVKATHEAEGVARPYRLVIPESAPAKGAALVVMLHGCTQDADDFATGTRMDRYALQRGFLVLYPEQPASLHPQRCWRWYEASHQRRDSGEAAQLMAMIRHVMEERSVDPGRVYVAGMSAGGAMAVVVAATHPEAFAAVASHSGVAYGAARSQEEARAVMAGELPDRNALARRLEAAMEEAGADSLPPLVVIHGAGDEAVDPANAESLAGAWMQAGIGGSGEGRSVTLRTVPGMGHAWAGGDPAGSYTDPTVRVDATEGVLAFFAHRADDMALDPERSETESGEDLETEPAVADSTGAGEP